MVKDIWFCVIDNINMWYTARRFKKWVKTLPPKKSFKKTNYMEWLQFNDPKKWTSIILNKE